MALNTFCCLFNLLLLALLVNGDPVPEGHGNKNVLCYFEATSAKKSHQEVRFVPEDLDISLCTHVVYNRAHVGQDLHVSQRDKEVDLREDGGMGLYDRTIALKEQKPGLKVILDLYDVDGVLKKALATNNNEALATFVQNAIEFIQARGFDGINFRVKDGHGFLETVPLLHEELSKRNYILMTFHLPLDPNDERAYELTEELSRNFDLIVLGSYWRLPREETTIFSSKKDLEREVSRYLDMGISSEKLVVAIPAFCVSLKLCEGDPEGYATAKLNRSVCGGGDEGMYEPPQMILYNSQIMRKVANTTEEWVITRDEESGVQFGHSKSLLWTSFEDPLSVRAKAALVLERNLAGVGIMNSDMEDFKGAYTENGETFPLTRAAYKALNGE